ncbi:MAG: DUF2007 domain-containing protein [Pseudomonadota bacterium]
MKVVYHAENIIDANLVKSLLDNASILAFVNGEFLAGAIGDVPASGLITVSVADSHEAEARKVVAEFEAERRDIADENDAGALRGFPGLAAD